MAATLRATIEETLKEAGVIHPLTGGVTHWNGGPRTGVLVWREDKNPEPITEALVVACANWMRETITLMMQQEETGLGK